MTAITENSNKSRIADVAAKIKIKNHTKTKICSLLMELIAEYTFLFLKYARRYEKPIIKIKRIVDAKKVVREIGDVPLKIELPEYRENM